MRAQPWQTRNSGSLWQLNLHKLQTSIPMLRW